MDRNELNAAFYEAQGGDSKAFAKIFDAFWSMAYYNCYKRLPGKQDAEDAVQEVFIILFRRIANLKGPEYLAKGIQYYSLEVCSSYAKSRKYNQPDKMVPLEEIFNNVSTQKEECIPEAVLERGELKAQIRELVDKLPKRQREVLINYYFNDFSAKEISKILKISVNAVGFNLYKARQKLSVIAGEFAPAKKDSAHSVFTQARA
jgi:RNA polymerase sigma-70 factor (ECF subfamily)